MIGFKCLNNLRIEPLFFLKFLDSWCASLTTSEFLIDLVEFSHNALQMLLDHFIFSQIVLGQSCLKLFTINLVMYQRVVHKKSIKNEQDFVFLCNALNHFLILRFLEGEVRALHEDVY